VYIHVSEIVGVPKAAARASAYLRKGGFARLTEILPANSRSRACEGTSYIARRKKKKADREGGNGVSSPGARASVYRLRGRLLEH